MQDKINEQNKKRKTRKRKMPKIDDDENEPSVSDVAEKVVSTIKHEDGDELINSYIADYAENLA